MCGALLSKFKRENKVAPTPKTTCLISQELSKKAQRLHDQEKINLKHGNVFTQTGSSLCAEDKKTICPTWFAYDLGLDGNVLHKGLKIKCPKKLEKDSKLPALTREMLLEKQARAEKNRIKEIEKKRKTAMKYVDIKQRKEEERMDKVAQKQVKVAENREVHLGRVESRASKVSYNTRSRLSEAQSFAKAQQTEEQHETKLISVKSERQRAGEVVVMKQRQRAARAQKVRQNVAKQQQEEDEIVQYMLADLESDPNFNASDSEHEEEGQWDDFWDGDFGNCVFANHGL